MSELKTPEDSFENEIHDLLLAVYMQSRRVTDLLYVLLRLQNADFADDLLDRHSHNEYIYPDVFPEDPSEAPIIP